MVQLMGSLRFEDGEDFSEEKYEPRAKRTRSSAFPFDQGISRNSAFPVSPMQYNPLDEPSPIGLRLKKSPSLVDLIQMKLSQGSVSSIAGTPAENVQSTQKNGAKGASTLCTNDKLKASNFPALLLRIGGWEFISKHEGDLVAKCYFAKHKLVWEVLEDGLKSKIEIQWSHIMGLKAYCPDNGPDTLTVVLARRPIFFQETNPQPRKHTLWQTSNDFTDGQAERNRQHFLQFSPGVLNKHFEKLIQCDMQLNALSKLPDIVMDSPYFDHPASGFENSAASGSDECSKPPSVAEGSTSSVFELVESGTVTSSSKFKFEQNPLAPQHVFKEAPSPSSVMDTQAIEGSIKITGHDSIGSKFQIPQSVPGLCSSVSMNNLMSHFENYISEKTDYKTLPSNKASESREMLENVAQVWLSDTQHAAGLDEVSLMKKVNSLCCLLQDPGIASCAQIEGRLDEGHERGKNAHFDLLNAPTHEGVESKLAFHGDKYSLNCKQASSIPREDSIGDFLLHLPRIASLPKFLLGIVEDEEFRTM